MDVVVGRIAKAHGIRGELAVDVRTDAPQERFAIGAVVATKLRDGSERELTVAAAREHSGRLLVRFEQVLTRDVAETLRGALLTVDTGALPPTGDPEEFYDHELAGLRAELADGTVLGTVAEVVHSPAGELLELDVDGREVLVPFVRAIVPTVDLAGGRVVLEPPEGLLE
ncbi:MULTISPECIES: ribosome maturation factor RimM [Amycolatopsis]|uniref:Ribosome maturation factor RimM n=2 Tax=Amycolatopsis TaxID=1813 RepID=A0A2A9F7D1_9PSEU|nr:MULTISPECIES: ribosome maturation factor RimM [Amycolatopsis]PFG46681.1 16S rRNA processing protein RimM [Amycolatopsis sulphurea]RJQ78301.1 ribosome maturation factor RimM [Amycolatopsis panacis]